MKNIAIVYFSGTGNTRFIAELIRDNFHGCQTDLFAVEDILNNRIDFDWSRYDTIGIGCMSIGFNAPQMITDFCKEMKNVTGKKVFLFFTCAGPCYLNSAALFGIKKILQRKGCQLIYEKVFVMPANVLLRYDDELMRRLYDAAVKKVVTMTSDIMNNVVKVRNDFFLPYLYRWIMVLSEKISLLTIPLDFRVGNTCNKCMKCIRNCPRNNISLKKEKIHFGFKCEACYRCVYGCPNRAIKGFLYNFAILKDGYDIRLKIERAKNTEIRHNLKGIYKTLDSYLNEE